MLVLRRAKLLGMGGVAALALAAPGSASGATTFGAALDKPPTASLNDEFTFAHAVVPISDQAPGGLTAPFDGVITRWRVKKGGADAASLAFRVLRGNASIHRGAAVETPTAAGTYAFDTRVPVQVGDRIGLDQLTVPSAMIAAGAVGASFHGWFPSLGESETRAPSATQASLFLLLNADLETDADGDEFGDESQDNCPTVANPDQGDADADGIGDVCDPTPLPPDIDPPDVTITKGAPNKTAKSKVRFKFVSDEAGSTFECKKDRRPFKPCTSPTQMKRLDEGKHKFRVRATDPAGNTGKAAKDKFRVVD